MSQRNLGVFPKSGKAMIKDALAQFKGIINQINEGVKKVRAKVSENTLKVEKIQKESDALVAAVEEAVIVAGNLESMMSGKIAIIPTDDADDAVDESSDSK